MPLQFPNIYWQAARITNIFIGMISKIPKKQMFLTLNPYFEPYKTKLNLLFYSQKGVS
jgi:hypothetical protein